MSSPFLTPDFLLTNPTARTLYHETAADLPIIDYHCHLSPEEVAKDRRFANLTAIWLDGDHYKWRAMRANGVPERLITGDAAPQEKYQAWAETLPMTWRNPLFHWSQLELSRYFGIDTILDESTAASVWQQANARLAEPDFSVHGILDKFKVLVVGTTDDPVDSLEWHEKCAATNLKTKIVPTYRPDKGFAVDVVDAWNIWVDKLAATCGMKISTYGEMLCAMKQRHDDFGRLGCRLSDHGLSQCPGMTAPVEVLEGIFARARSGQAATAEEAEQFAGSVLMEVGRWNAEKGWTMQLHLGAQRNNNSRMLGFIGRDTGYDSIGDLPQAEKLAAFLDSLASTDQLPKTILYNLNPADNYVFATMIGNFNEGPAAGKVQLGSGWWFLDQKEGMEWQINALSNLGLLSRFVGMTTDSRSFLSYPRHEYFRRVLCNLIGKDVEDGLLPRDMKRLTRMVEAICYTNARDYFGFQLS